MQRASKIIDHVTPTLQNRTQQNCHALALDRHSYARLLRHPVITLLSMAGALHAETLFKRAPGLSDVSKRS